MAQRTAQSSSKQSNPTPTRRRTSISRLSRAKAAQPLALTLDEARGLALAAQGLFDPPSASPSLADVRAMIERLGVVQIDTISVVERSQYIVLWSRLGPYDATLLDQLLYPTRAVFEYWSHAASIVPMSDYPYYRRDMLRGRELLWEHLRMWMDEHPTIIAETLEAIHTRGPLASADFEASPDAQRTGPWDWYGPKESRRALDALWTLGDLMVHSRRGGQKLYDLRERMLAEAFGDELPDDDKLPTDAEALRHFALHTTCALGVTTPAWLWDYFRLGERYQQITPDGAAHPKRLGKIASAQATLDHLAHEGALIPASVEGIAGAAYVAPERLADLERLRAGETPTRTTLLSPFDNLIWDRLRTRTLFGYQVCFEAYVVPAKRRYGYYCLAILHHGRLVGRLDPKMDRQQRRLLVRAVYLEPGVIPDETLLTGLANALHELATWLGARSITIERSEPEGLAERLRSTV